MKTTSISQLAATGTALDLTLAEVRGQVTVKKLRTRGPRRGELLGKVQGGGRALGGVGTQDTVIFGQAATGSRWAGDHNQCGIGRDMVDNLDKVVANYNKVIASEQKESRRQEAAERRALREAQSFNALDSLLETL